MNNNALRRWKNIDLTQPAFIAAIDEFGELQPVSDYGFQAKVTAIIDNPLSYIRTLFASVGLKLGISTKSHESG